MATIFITGATGFIGRALCLKILESGWKVKGTFRWGNSAEKLPMGVEGVRIDFIENCTSFYQYLEGVDTVIHLAASVHVMNNVVDDQTDLFRKVNVLGTECLAKACVQAGVGRFIFISSIGVNGEFTDKEPFVENSTPNPAGAYAVSKWEAEQVLHKISKETGMEVVILRAPLVYGLNAPGNFKRLIHLIKAGIPLPLGNINSLRSFLYVGNLVDAISTCISHPLAAGETFLVSDGQDVSTPDLIKMIACAMGKKAVLFSFPPGLLKLLFKSMHKGEDLEKLTGNLLIDSSKIRNLLGWKPSFTLEEGIRETVRGIGK